MTTSPDVAYRAAVAQLPPGACPLLTRVEEVRVRRTREDPWEMREIPEGSPAAATLTKLMLRALNDPSVHDLVDLASRREVFRHLEPCPLCRHREAPGPRVYAVWHTDPQEAAEWEQGRRTPDLNRLLELPNTSAAEEWARATAGFFAARVERAVGGRVEMQALLVPADPEQLPGHRLLIAAADSELWLWNTRPASPDAMRHPDQVVSLHREGTLTFYDGQDAAARRPVLEAPAPQPSLFKTEHGTDGRKLTWFDDGCGGLLVSVLDPHNSRPAVRVTAQGEEELPGAPSGLRVFGRHLGERPPLSAITLHEPTFADLVPEASWKPTRRASRRRAAS